MSATYVVANQEYLYTWGVTKKSSECQLRPELYDGLDGWPISSVSVGPTSSIAAPKGENGAISWGPSPTYGELGYGEKGAGKNGSRSSTVTKFVDDLGGCKVLQTVMAAGYSCVLVSREGKSGETVQRLPLLEPPATQVEQSLGVDVPEAEAEAEEEDQRELDEQEQAEQEVETKRGGRGGGPS